MKLRPVYTFLLLLGTAGALYVSDLALAEEEPAASAPQQYPFKLGRLDPDGQPVQFIYSKEQNLLTFIHHAEFRAGEKQGKRLRVELHLKDKSSYESQNGCHFHSRLFFLPVLFQHFLPDQVESIEFFSSSVVSCDPLEDAKQQTQSEIKGNVSVNQLKQNLDDPDWMVRVQAIRALETKAPSSISILKESLGAIDLGQREYAALALERINTSESRAALGGHQAASPDFTIGESTWVTKDGLSLDVKPTQTAFPFGSMLSFDLTLKNDTDKVMSVYDPPMCDLSWNFRMEDLKHGGQWIGYFPRTYEVVSPQPVYLKAGESFRVRCPVDLFYWKASQDVETPVSRWDVWERHLPEGKYQIRAKVTLGLPYTKPESAYMFWIGSLESKPVLFEITPNTLVLRDKSKWTEAIEKMKTKYPHFGLWKAMIETSGALGDENISLRLKSIQFLSGLVGVLDLDQRQEFLPIFMDLFSDEDASVRHLVSEALSGLQMNPTSALEQSLKKDSENLMKKDHYDSAMWTIRTLKKLKTPESQKVLSNYAVDLKNYLQQTKDGDLKAAYMELIQEIGSPAEIIFLEELKNPDPQARTDAALALGLLRSRKSSELLMALLEDKSDEVVATAAYSLIALMTKPAEKAVLDRAESLLPLLVKQFQSDYVRVRWRAVYVIKSLGSKRADATSDLIRLLSLETASSVRLLAYKTLEGIDTAEAKKAVMKYKGKAEVEEKASSLKLPGLKQAKPLEEKKETPQEKLKDYVYSGRTSGVMRGDVFSKGDLAFNETQSEKENNSKAPPKLLDGKPVVVKARQPGDFEKLKEQALSDERPSQREAAATELADFGEAAIPVLAKAMQDSEFHVRFSARLALIKIGTPEAREAAKLKSKNSANAKSSSSKTT